MLSRPPEKMVLYLNYNVVNREPIKICAICVALFRIRLTILNQLYYHNISK